MTSSQPSIQSRVLHLDEPLLEFRHNQRLVHLRDGLFLYGPVGDPKHLPSICDGVIGMPDGVRSFRAWATSMAGFIDISPPGPRSRAVEPQHVPFPGFAGAFYAACRKRSCAR